MIDLSADIPLADLIEMIAGKGVVPSALRSADWERLVPAGVREQAFFSAGVTHGEFLAQFQKRITDLIGRARATNEKGQDYWAQDKSRIIAEMRQMGERMELPHPEGREGGRIKESDLTDPLSVARLRLVVDTQLEMAYGKTDWQAAHDPAVLKVWPAQELVRISPRKRQRDWDRRWREAGGTFYKGRKIALKIDPIWVRISRFGTPYPPYDYWSGKGLEDVMRTECKELGVPLVLPEGVEAVTPESHAEQMQASVAAWGLNLRERFEEVRATLGK